MATSINSSALVILSTLESRGMMWAAMRRQKRRRLGSVASGAEAEAEAEAEDSGVRLIMGWGGSGKSRQGFEFAARSKGGVVFLSLTAALLSSVPDSVNVVLKLTIAAFVNRPDLIIPAGACLYIDEVSMVPPHLMDTILRRARGHTVLCTGDVFQIQPIAAATATRQWFFESPEFVRRGADATVVTEQHRLTGPECADVRRLLEAVAFQKGGADAEWKHEMTEFVLSRVAPSPPAAQLIVFSNDQIRRETTAWAKRTGAMLDRHGLCVGLPATITTNKIEASSSTRVTYTYRNGDTGVIERITDHAVGIRVDGTLVTVPHGGVGNVIPQVKSAVAQTADAAQGKTIDDPVHVVFPSTFFPHPARILVAASRSKVVSFAVEDKAAFARGMQEAAFDPKAVAYAKKACRSD